MSCLSLPLPKLPLTVITHTNTESHGDRSGFETHIKNGDLILLSADCGYANPTLKCSHGEKGTCVFKISLDERRRRTKRHLVVGNRWWLDTVISGTLNLVYASASWHEIAGCVIGVIWAFTRSEASAVGSPNQSTRLALVQVSKTSRTLPKNGISHFLNFFFCPGSKCFFKSALLIRLCLTLMDSVRPLHPSSYS